MVMLHRHHTLVLLPRFSSSCLGQFRKQRAGKFSRAPKRMAKQDHRTRRSSSGRVVLSAAGWPAEVAPGSARRSVGGEPQAWGDGVAAPDSVYRSDPGG